MPSINFDNQQRFVPGAFTKTEVRSSLPGGLPALHIPVMLGEAPTGRPYNAADSALDVEGTVRPWELCGTASKVAREFGYESELHIGAKYAWRHKLPQAYVINLAPLTRASLDFLDGVANEQLTIYPKKYGAPTNPIQVGYNATTDSFTITPLKSFAMVAADVSAGGTRVYTKGQHGWLSEGATVYIADSAQTPVQRVITDAGVETDANGQNLYWFEVNTAIASGVATASYALVYQYDTAGTITGTGLGTPQAVLDWINTDPAASQVLVAEKHANYDGTDLATVATTTIGWDAAATAATSPAMTNTQLADFIADMDAGQWEAFTESQQVIPHSYLLLSSNSTMHGTLRDYAIAERSRNYPIAVTAGVGWGDVIVDAGDDTDPTFRAGALNSQDFCLCAGGLDRLDSYLSLAPAVFGLRVAGGPGHNLTNDQFIYSDLEVLWDEIASGELTSLLKAGVVTYKLSVGQSILYAIAQGLSTLQNNAGAIWNEVDSTTWSLMQRDLADFANIVIKRDMESLQVGANGVDETTVGAVLFRRAARSLLKKGYITDFNIVSITLNDAGSGYDVVWNVKLPTTTDFITITTVILLGD